MRLYDYNEKAAIFKQSSKRKETNYSVSDDYSRETAQKRTLLWRSAQEDKRNGAKMKLVCDELFIDRAAYMWYSQSNRRVLANNQDSLSLNRD